MGSCQDTPQGAKPRYESHFRASHYEVKYQKATVSEKITLLTQLFEHEFDNPVVFEKWARKHLLGNSAFLQTKEIELLKELVMAVYHSNFDQLAAKFASEIIQVKNENLQAVKPSANAVLTYYYQLTYNHDSLKTALHGLGQGLKYDPARWLRISYHSGMAHVANRNSKFLDALIRYKKALSVTPVHDIQNLRMTELNIALLYLKFDLVEKARIHIKKSNALGIKDLPADLLNTMAICLSKTGDHRAAIKLFKYTLNYARINNLKLLEAQTLANYGNAKRRMKQFAEALNLMSQSDVLCRSLGVQVGLVINELNRAELYNDQKSYEELSSSLSILSPQLKALNDIAYLIDFYRLSYQLQDALGNQQLANTYFRKHSELQDKHLGDRSRSILIEWELAQVRDEQNFEKSNLRLAIQKQENQKLLYAFVLVLSLLVTSFILLILYRRASILRIENMKVKQRMTFDLELKSKELLAESLKNISVLQLKEELDQILSATIDLLPKSHHDKFEALQRLLKTAPSKGFLEEFETRFKGVYEDFYIKLRSLAPALTPHEIRICALMRLNISSKEMAILTNRTQGTIDNTRSVIRKKLNLDDHVNLQEYILAI
jgi:tetratricopeptide (TPR) repeat protein